jgi:pyruvate-formate lyase-activating enzyme
MLHPAGARPARPAAGMAFHLVEGILLVRLMSRCNEKCLFCMVADEIATSDDVAFRDAIARIAAQRASTQIEFFGGEPTIYPRFLDLLRFARSRGHRCSIASNLRIFHNAAFTRSVAELGARDIYIRTSIYGHTEALHDHYTAARGSYRQTVRGIGRVVEAGFPCQVNVVLLRENLAVLGEIVRQVHAWGVPRIKFGMLTGVESCAAHAVTIAEVAGPLQQAIALAESLGLKVTVEKTPVCAIRGRLDLLSTEREIYGGHRVFDDAGPCGGCLVRRWCDGLDPGYVQAFGTAGLQALDGVPHATINASLDDAAQPPLLEMRCVQIPDGPLAPQTAEAIAALAGRVQARHGGLAVFPARFLRRRDHEGAQRDPAPAAPPAGVGAPGPSGGPLTAERKAPCPS